MIGIIAAMDQEVEAVKAEMEVSLEKSVAGIRLIYGTIGSREVCLLKSGIGKALAAMAAAIACLEHPLEALINVGVAGGLDPDQHVMDIVISSEAIQADFDTTPIDGEAGRGLIYRADPVLVEKAVEALEEMQVPYMVGTVASQDLFMAREEDYQKLMKYFPQSKCSEMEGAAIAAVANAFGIPFLVIRSLSDVVHHSENPMEFSQFASVASLRAARLVKAILE